ncbi:MAG: GDP-mannose 4,6-dehydratase [Thaumarchaeota archaeon]|nr:GDP-mannose 4,6-dehydratase [Candidatus Terraquivivens yellowstonensis]
MRVLVTGATGFIGSHLCLRLLDLGMEVHGLDDLSRGSLKRAKILENSGMSLHKADVRDWATVHEVLHEVKPDAVIHLAALISVEESIRMPELYMEVNAEGTRNIVRAASNVGSGRLIYASSAAVYGNPIRLPIAEDHPTSPLSPYGLSKLMGERYVTSEFIGREKPVILRIFNVYGPGQNPEYAGVITKFMERLSQGDPPIIFGDGEQTRDFIHVDDVVEAFIRSLDTPLNETAVLNVGSGRPFKIIELARMMIRLYGLNVEPIHVPPRPGDVRGSYADISLAKRLLGWNPKISLEEGLRRLIVEGDT